MSKRQYDDIFDTLSETHRLLRDLEVPEGEEFSLSAILAEFGQGAAEPAPDRADPVAELADEQPAPVAEVTEEAPAEEPFVPAEEIAEEEEVSAPEEEVLPELPEEEAPKETLPTEEEPVPAVRRKVLLFPKLFSRKEESGSETPAEERGEEAAEEAPEDYPEEQADEPAVFVEEQMKTVDEELPKEEEAAQHISLEDVMARTVDAVLEEQEDEEPEMRIPLNQRLLSVWGSVLALAGEWKEKLALPRAGGTAEEQAEEPWEPEPDMEQADREERRRGKRLRRQLISAGIPTLLLVAFSVLETWWPELLAPVWGSLDMLRTALALALLGLTAMLSGEVWKYALSELKQGRFTCEAGAMLPTLAVFGDCVYSVSTHSAEYLPLAAPAALLIWLCLLGRVFENTSRRSAYHLADLGGRPPYAVAVNGVGACKQQGRLDGFYHTSCKSDPSRRAQTILLPLLLSAATVLAGVVCISERRMDEFFRVWAAILSVSVPLSLPLSGTLPIRHLNRRLCRSGCAVAGYAGARAVSESRRMVVTDGDLFPPGTVSLNGLKLYGEEIGKVVSYAATMTRAARSQLQPIFEQLLSSEGGSYQRVEDLRFYEEGGFSGTIHGETVSMGSAYFMKKHKVDLPRELKVKTGVFLAVDGQLIAIFAMKYQASRNVEWALRAMRRNRIEPVLAVRSGNITPGLIKRRFNLEPRAVYPEVSARLALSDLSEELAPAANAIIYREGLMPFAETVIGSRRCCRMVRWSTALCWLGSLVGLWLGYYLTHTAAYGALSAGYVLVFGLLWLLPSLLLGDLTRRY